MLLPSRRVEPKEKEDAAVRATGPQPAAAASPPAIIVERFSMTSESEGFSERSSESAKKNSPTSIKGGRPGLPTFNLGDTYPKNEDRTGSVAQITVSINEFSSLKHLRPIETLRPWLQR